MAGDSEADRHLRTGEAESGSMVGAGGLSQAPPQGFAVATLGSGCSRSLCLMLSPRVGKRGWGLNRRPHVHCTSSAAIVTAFNRHNN